MPSASRALRGALMTGLLLAAAEARAHPEEGPPPSAGPAASAVAPPPPPPAPERVVHAPLHLLTLGFEVQRAEGRMVNSVHGSLEPGRLGLFARASELPLSEEARLLGGNGLRLATAHLGWALVARRMLRLRAEAGLSYAQGAHVTMLGPSVGASGQLQLLGLFALEARAQLTVLPYRQLDAAAGVAVHLGPLAVRAGRRLLVVQGVDALEESLLPPQLSGPYVSVGVAF